MGDIELENRKPGKLKPKISSKACVIMVGSTNTGKSRTVNIMTKSTDCMIGEITDTKPCTQKPKLVEKDTELIYMDNPGWDDPEKSNRATFRDILIKIKERGSKVKAVIWCMEAQRVVIDSLKTQAGLIDHFLGKEIWSNVVILAMGGMQSHPVEVRCQGATTAARELPNRSNIDFTGRLISYELGRTSTEEEARENIQTVLNTLQEKTVEFSDDDYVCQRCGQEGDLRLMTDMCHLEKGHGHDKDLITRFTIKQVGLGLTVTAAAATGVTLATVFGSPFSLFIVPFTLPCLWPAISRGCCGSGCGQACVKRTNCMGSGEDGCAFLAYVSPKEEWPCCEKPKGNEGCEDVCIALQKKGINCGGATRGKQVRWGEKEGCVYIVKEIPKGDIGAFTFIPGIVHDPAQKINKEKKEKKNGCCS